MNNMGGGSKGGTRRRLTVFCTVGVLLFAGLFFLPHLHAFERISLDSNSWLINEGFQPEWTAEEFEAPEDSTWIKRPGGSYQRILDIAPGPKNELKTWTFITWFDAPAEMIDYPNALGLRLPGIGEAWQIYINGKMIADEHFLDEKGNIRINRTVRGTTINFSGHVLKEKNNLLAFKITGHTRFRNTGLYYYPGYEIDDFKRMERNHSEMMVLVLLGLYLLASMYHLVLFLKRKKEKYNLYFGSMAFFVVIYFLSRTDFILHLVPAADIVHIVEIISLFTLFPFLIAFVEHLIFSKVSKFTKIYAAFWGIVIIAVPFVPMSYTDYIIQAWQGIALLVVGYFLYLFYKGYRAGVPEVKPMLAAILILSVTITFDILDFIFFHTGFAFSKYGTLVAVIGTAIILANKFMRVYNEAEDLNVNLELRVKERTDELQQTLKTVEDLKEKQDGDYYLTSLLMAPLARNDVSSKNIRVESRMQQNKSFEFRGKTNEIGGDLNIATSISLHGKKHIAFLNSDAMGKSIQGAGGALVTGAIYNAFLNRSKLVNPYQRLFPELWLRDCLLDLSNVFSIFKGSMFTSLCMGLVDDETGFVYYVNAEHPLMVLYKEGKATYLEKDIVLRRIGMEFEEEDVIIKTYQMKPGDQLISGSDGRDDIFLGVTDEGVRILNDDVEAFLNHVEKGRGDLNDIYTSILEQGSLTDDFTLLSIAYSPDEAINSMKYRTAHELPDEVHALIKKAKAVSEKGNRNEALSLLRSAKEKSGGHSTVLQEIIKVYVRDSKFDLASEISEQFSSDNPHDHELLYLTSYSMKMKGEYGTAADYGERLRLRKPGIAKNLFNLADTYRLMGSPVKAQEVLHQGLSIENDNAYALRLKKALENTPH